MRESRIDKRGQPCDIMGQMPMPSAPSCDPCPNAGAAFCLGLLLGLWIGHLARKLLLYFLRKV